MPSRRRWNGTQRLSGFWLFFAALAAFWAHLNMAASGFHADTFDYALFLLQPVYAAHGLRPYADFGFLYPPGPALILGKLLHCSEPWQVQIAVSALDALAVALSSLLVMRLAKAHPRFAGGLTLLCLGAVVPMMCMLEDVDPCPLSLTALTLLLALATFRRRCAMPAWGFAAAAAVTTLWRWDRALPIMILLALGAASLWGVSGVYQRDATRLRKIASRLFVTALIGLAGTAAGFAVMALWGLATGSWAAEKEFVFHLPLVVSVFRRVPIPNPDMPYSQCGADLLAILLLAWIAVSDGRLLRGRILPARLASMFVLLAGPVALVPYAIHRPDGIHFLPLSVTLITAMIAAGCLCPRTVRPAVAIGFSLVLLPVGLMAIRQVLVHGAGPNAVFSQSMARLTRGCSALIPADSRSLFVGQQTYSGYLKNAPVLYLARPDLRPATPFITDEPGIQNTCGYGARIAGDLTRAPRPLVLALDTTTWPQNADLGVPVQSCGKIEVQLAALPATQLGTCTMAGHVFKVETVR